MRGLALICILATTNLAIAQDLDEWARRCLDKGDPDYGSVVCQGFRAGVEYQQRPIIPLTITPGGLPDPGATPFATNGQFEQYLRDQSEILTTYADMISQGGEAPSASMGVAPAPGAQMGTPLTVEVPPSPDMLRYDDPTGKPLVDF